MKIESFNRTNLAALRSDLDDAVQKLAVKYGVELIVGNMVFNPSEVKIKMTARSKGDKVAEAFATLMKDFYGLRANEEINGKTLVRYDRKKFKFPFIYKDRAGKMFKCSEEAAKLYFGGK